MHLGVSPDGKVVVGGFNFTDAMTAPMRGYLASGDTPVLFDFPFAISTVATDINGAGEIVGTYIDAAKTSHGFLLRMGDAINTFGVNPQTAMTGPFDFTTIDYPGAVSTELWGINSAGDMVGDYVDGSGKTHGFVLNRAPRRGQ
jgi:hypothetical protein